MKRWIYFLVLLLPMGCSQDKTNIYFTPEKARWYFSEIETACNRDNGKLWGKNLYGPVMFIDRPTRKIIANMPDNEGILKLKDGIYTGSYPREMIIDNTSKIFGGTLYSCSALMQVEDTTRTIGMALQGLYLCHLVNIGKEIPRYNTRQIDDKNARLWLKLEWHALKKALTSTGDFQKQSLRDALIFRGARRELFPKEVKDENAFESVMGLSFLSYAILSTQSPEQAGQRLLKSLDDFYGFQSYARTYGYIHGALYGFLAYEKEFDFKAALPDTVDLARVVKELYDIQLPEICRDVAGSLALGYDLENIYKEEDTRLSEIKDRLHRRISVFTEKPVVYVELESPYFDFEPEEVRSLDTLGTIYNSIRVLDNWGKLTVEKGGCLVSSNLKTIRVTAKNLTESKNHISGDGWHLILNSDWQMVKVEENYFIRKLMP
jgi:hypothetical protein